MSAWPRRLARRLRALFRARDLDRELDDEIRLHVELETAELMDRERLSLEEARRRALVAFGGVERYREAHRDARGVSWVQHRLQDVRYAVRGLRNNPGFALAVVLAVRSTSRRSLLQSLGERIAVLRRDISDRERCVEWAVHAMDYQQKKGGGRVTLQELVDAPDYHRYPGDKAWTAARATS